MKLTPTELKLLKAIKAEKEQELKKTGSYLGYLVPALDSPELTPKQKKLFTQERKILRSLVRKKILMVVTEDRRATVYDEWE